MKVLIYKYQKEIILDAEIEILNLSNHVTVYIYIYIYIYIKQ